MGLFNKVTVNMTSCAELEDEEDREEESRKILQKGMIKLWLS